MVNPLPPTGPVLPAASVTRTPPADTVSTWRVGQVLAATVTAAAQPGEAELRIGTLQVRAQTGTLQLAAGQQLRLEVASLREQPVLKLLGLLQANPSTLALRDALPRQQPLTPLLTTLARVAAGAAGTPPLPPAVTQLARELFERLPSAAGIASAGGLRQALRDSGLFLETKLAAAAQSAGTAQAAPPGADTARDFKANLLRLVAVVREHVANSAPATRPSAGPSAAPGASTGPGAAVSALPLPTAATTTAATAAAVAPLGMPLPHTSAPLPRGQPPLPPLAARAVQEQELPLTARELLRQADGALARVQLNQLASLPQERQPGMEWLIELPVRREAETDVWSLRIGRDPERGEERAAGGTGGGWNVMLAFDLPGIGPLQARVNLRGEQVSAQFFSRTPGTLALVQEHLPVLQARLRQAGLRIDEISCHHGQIPPAATPAYTRLLDERA